MVNRLFRARELDRRQERWGQSRFRWRYFRRRLEGEIVDLDRAFREVE